MKLPPLTILLPTIGYGLILAYMPVIDYAVFTSRSMMGETPDPIGDFAVSVLYLLITILLAITTYGVFKTKSWAKYGTGAFLVLGIYLYFIHESPFYQLIGVVFVLSGMLFLTQKYFSY
jgi:hypothetical protein